MLRAQPTFESVVASDRPHPTVTISRAASRCTAHRAPVPRSQACRMLWGKRLVQAMGDQI